MNTIDNTYEEIAQHSRRGRKRDIVFAVLLAAVAAFSIASLRSAQQTVDAVPATSPCASSPWC